MKIIPFRTWCGPVLLVVSLFFTGCNESGGGSSNEFEESSTDSPSSQTSSASYPKIAGKWTGVYVVEGGSDEFDGQTVTAKIKQNRDAVVINTNLPTVGRMFTGSIDQDGKMRLTDAFDGELWTTYFGPATTSSMRIADFLERPTIENPNPPIAVINLSK